MKKRLLITSIVMMLVVAVALSTATYAWFTSNDSVTASSMALTASVSGESSLGIGWLGGEPSSNISANVTGTLLPMAPAALEKGVTTSDVLFMTSTIKTENGQEQFNGGSASYVAKVETQGTNVAGKYELVGGVYVQTADATADGSKTYYTKNAAPVVYNNGTTQVFYVRNLSDTNPIASVTVALDDVHGNDETFQPAKSATAVEGVTYYTVAAVNTEGFNSETSVDSYFIAKGLKYVKATGTYVDGTAYYTVTEDDSIETGNETTGKYEVAEATDMIRVAIFTKAAALNGASSGNYTLLGVLGNAATAYNQVTSGSWDKNTTYYVKSGASEPYTYTQTVITAEQFATYLDSENENYGKLYTAVNTAVYGASAKFVEGQNVRDLSHYEVKTSLTFDTGLAALQQFEIVAIAWLDGTELVDFRAGEFGQVSLKFTAA